MEIQMKENDDRMSKLETQVSELASELSVSGTSSRKRSSKNHDQNGDRPAWFGAPYWLR